MVLRDDTPELEKNPITDWKIVALLPTVLPSIT